MTVELRKPELEKYIREQVDAGLFESAEAAVAAAVERMMSAPDWAALTDEDVEGINESEAQIDRGEFVEFREFAAELRAKLKGT